MALTQRGVETMHGYTTDEVARFLQYDPEAVRYWLRTGHLTGRFDPQIGDWRVAPGDLVTFLRQSSEPMPTGVVPRSTPLAVAAQTPRAAFEPAAADPARREPALVGSGRGIAPVPAYERDRC